MELKSIILIIIAILIIALVGVGLFMFGNGSNDLSNITDNLNLSDSSNVTVENTTNATVVGDDSPRENATTANNNTTEYKVYNPQSDSYVPVIGEKYDDEVNRWYTYDSDGVRYYNTRIN